MKRARTVRLVFATRNANQALKAIARSISFYLPLAGLLLGGSQWLRAQDALEQEAIASHLMVYVPPTYPSIAIAAQVQGDVVLKVEIGPDGLVRSVKAISGPPMLLQA